MSKFPPLSILIPVYNYNVNPLVESLLDQGRLLQLTFEIRVYDDASEKKYKQLNQTLSSNAEVVYKELAENICRSKIRNLLAQEAAYENLLFLDCDSKIPNKYFIERYLLNNTSDAIIGGTIYEPRKPKEKQFTLHWKAGKYREERNAGERQLDPYHSITLNNILLHKDTFMKIKLDESITSYGHEDTKFGQQLEELRINIRHIDNPVIHKGLNPSEDYLNKTKQALANLYRLYTVQGYGADTGVVKAYERLKKLQLTGIFKALYKPFAKIVEKNLISGIPSLFLFDMFKLYHFAQLNSEAEKKRIAFSPK